MRTSGKIVLGAVVLAALAGVGGYAATVVMRNRVIAEVDGAFAALRPNMAKAEHGGIQFDIWSRTLKINAVNLLPKDGGADRATTIARITASGVKRDGTRFSADKLEIGDLTTWTVYPGFGNSAVRYDIPALTAERLAFDPAKAGAIDGSVASLRRVLLATAATTMTAPLVNLSTTMDAPPSPSAKPQTGAPPKVTVEQTQKDVRIEGLANGRIAKGAASSMSMRTKSAAPEGNIEAEIADMTMADYDIAGALGIADPQASATQGVLPMWQSGSTGLVKAKIGQLATVSLTGISIGKGGFDPARLKKAMAVINAQQQAAAAAPGRPTLQQQLAMTNSAAEIYEAIEIGSLEYRGLAVDAIGVPPVKLAKIVVADFKGGSIGKFELEGLDGAAPTGEAYKLGRFSLKGLRIAELIRLTGRMSPGPGARQPQPAQFAGEFMKLLEAIELEQLEFPDRATKETVTIERMKTSWGAVVGAVPTVGQFSVKLKPPAGAYAREPFAMLARAGLKAAPAELKGEWKWDEASQKVQIGPIEIGQAGVGAMNLQVSFSNVSRQAIVGGAAYLPVSASEITLAGAEIGTRDGGLVKLMMSDPIAAPQYQQAIAALKMENPTQPPEPVEIAAIKAALARFLEAPGQRLDVKVAPKSKLTLLQLMTASGGASDVMSLLATETDTTAKVSPAQ